MKAKKTRARDDGYTLKNVICFRVTDDEFEDIEAKKQDEESMAEYIREIVVEHVRSKT
jgi:hypothetical protein